MVVIVSLFKNHKQCEHAGLKYLLSFDFNSLHLSSAESCWEWRRCQYRIWSCRDLGISGGSATTLGLEWSAICAAESDCWLWLVRSIFTCRFAAQSIFVFFHEITQQWDKSKQTIRFHMPILLMLCDHCQHFMITPSICLHWWASAATTPLAEQLNRKWLLLLCIKFRRRHKQYSLLCTTISRQFDPVLVWPGRVWLGLVGTSQSSASVCYTMETKTFQCRSTECGKHIIDCLRLVGICEWLNK